METEKTRYYLVDGIRGVAIVNMALFHFLYDVFIVYEKNPLWYGLPGVHMWQQMICQTFIFISGFVWQWGMEGNFRRCLRFNLYGLLISLVTLIVIPSETIWFGILNFMGCAILLMFPLQKAVKKFVRFRVWESVFFCSSSASGYSMAISGSEPVCGFLKYYTRQRF